MSSTSDLVRLGFFWCVRRFYFLRLQPFFSALSLADHYPSSDRIAPGRLCLFFGGESRFFFSFFFDRSVPDRR